jgi:hypothetical protein
MEGVCTRAGNAPQDIDEIDMESLDQIRNKTPIKIKIPHQDTLKDMLAGSIVHLNLAKIAERNLNYLQAGMELTMKLPVATDGSGIWRRCSIHGTTKRYSLRYVESFLLSIVVG